MAGKITQLRDNQIRNLGGFSLVELMITLALLGIVTVSLNSLMASQDRTYKLQDRSAEMDQNLRAAMDTVSRDVMNSGRGPGAWSTISGADASAWYNAANGWRPYGIATANTVHLIGCLDSSAGTLSAQANAGANTITLNAAIPGVAVGSDINIGGDVGLNGENAKVTAVAGTTLTISTSATAAVSLQRTHVSGTGVCRLQWVTYAVGAGNVLTVTSRAVNGTPTTQTVADRISGMTLASDVTDPRLLTVTLNGLTAGSVGIATSVTNRAYRRNN
jgi:prepilin-type N-terminal cleavage/methylation domain-containing protein